MYKNILLAIDLNDETSCRKPLLSAVELARHFAHSEPVAPSRKLAQGSRRRRPALDVPGQNLKLTHSSADPDWSYLVA